MDEERMRPGHWLGLVIYVRFIVLSLMVGWHEGHPDCKKRVPLIPAGSILEQIKEEDPRRKLFNPYYPGKTDVKWK